MKNWCPGEDSNLDSKFLRNQSLNAVGLFELPRKLPTSIARRGGTPWHRLGSHEPAFTLGTAFANVPTVVARKRVPPPIRRAQCQQMGDNTSELRTSFVY